MSRYRDDTSVSSKLVDPGIILKYKSMGSILWVAQMLFFLFKLRVIDNLSITPMLND